MQVEKQTKTIKRKDEELTYGQISKFFVRSWAPKSACTVCVHSLFARGRGRGRPVQEKLAVYTDCAGRFGGSAPDKEFRDLPVRCP